MKAHLHYIKNALDTGHRVSVFDSEEWAVKKSRGYKEIKDACEATEEGWIVVSGDSGQVGRAMYIFDHDQDPAEIIADYTVTDFNEAWWEKYKKDNPNW